MIKWRKILYNEDLEFVDNTIYLLPHALSGCEILYGNEYCIAKNFSVQEVIDKLKAVDCDMSELPKTEIKTIITNILKEN